MFTKIANKVKIPEFKSLIFELKWFWSKFELWLGEGSWLLDGWEHWKL
jgi:hypothetical protein